VKHSIKEKEEKIKSAVEGIDGRKYKWNKVDMDKFRVIASKVKILRVLFSGKIGLYLHNLTNQSSPYIVGPSSIGRYFQAHRL
jgi:hypothetical protein